MISSIFSSSFSCSCSCSVSCSCSFSWTCSDCKTLSTFAPSKPRSPAASEPSLFAAAIATRCFASNVAASMRVTPATIFRKCSFAFSLCMMMCSYCLHNCDRRLDAGILSGIAFWTMNVTRSRNTSRHFCVSSVHLWEPTVMLLSNNSR